LESFRNEQRFFRGYGKKIRLVQTLEGGVEEKRKSDELILAKSKGMSLELLFRLKDPEVYREFTCSAGRTKKGGKRN